jgi:hypothetical protein
MAGSAATRRSRAGLRVLATLAVCAGLGWLAAPAQADSGTLPDAQYYRSTVTAIAPTVPGLSITVTPTGDWFQVSYTGDGEVVVLGYTGEPYVRLTRSGVQENVASFSSFLNDNLVISGMPQDSTPRAPQWVPRPGATFRWHDHRVHWMSAERPAPVAADPQRAQQVLTWTVRMIVSSPAAGSTPVTVTGRLDWVGKPGLLSGVRGGMILVIAALSVAGFAVMLVRIARVKDVPVSVLPA